MKWTRKRIEELCNLKSGGTPRRGNDHYYGGDIPWVKIGDIESNSSGIINETEESITKSGLESIHNRLFPEGTIFLAMYGSVGKVAIAGKTLSCNQAILGIQVKDEEELNNVFLKYWLEAHKKVFISKARGVALQNISATIVKREFITYPPLSVQKQIVTVLDKAQGLIQKRQRAQAQLDKLLRDSFLDMFGDTYLNPKEWEKYQIRTICSEIVDCPHSTPKYSNHVTEFPCIRTSEIKNGRISWGSMKYTDNEGYLKRTKRLIPIEGDIVFGREGTVGEAAMIPSDTKMSLGQRVMLLRPDENLILKEFLWGWFQSQGTQSLIEEKIIGVAAKRINISDVKTLEIIAPPVSEQEQYAKVARKAELIHQKLDIQLRQIDDLFNSLMQKAFKGKLKFVDEQVEIENSLNTAMEFQKQLDALKPFHEHAKKLQTIQNKFKDIFDSESFRSLRQLNEKIQKMNLPAIGAIQELQRKMEQNGFSNLTSIPSLENIEAIKNSVLGRQLQIDKAIAKAYVKQQKRIEEETGERKRFIKKVDWKHYSIEQIKDKIVEKFSVKYFTMDDLKRFFEEEAGILVQYDNVYDKNGTLQIKGMKDFFFENLQGEKPLFKQHFVQLAEHYNEQFFPEIMQEKEERAKELYKMFLSINQ